MPQLNTAEAHARSVMHELQVSQPALMRFLQSLQFAVEKIEAFDIADNRRLSRFMCGFEVGGAQRAADAVMDDQLVHPREAIEMISVELPRCGRAQRRYVPSRR